MLDLFERMIYLLVIDAHWIHHRKNPYFTTADLGGSFVAQGLILDFCIEAKGFSFSASLWITEKSHSSYSCTVPITGYVVVKCLYQPANDFFCSKVKSSNSYRSLFTSLGSRDIVANEYVASQPAQSEPYPSSPACMLRLEDTLTTSPHIAMQIGNSKPLNRFKRLSVNLLSFGIYSGGISCVSRALSSSSSPCAPLRVKRDLKPLLKLPNMTAIKNANST
mmetsp:Transcript_68568/g.107193  ORF Transcript_68568/g.107193 Transcript_68568/m.107193 type:complete len:221 (+) Transcript_68568:129-791(+)